MRRIKTQLLYLVGLISLHIDWFDTECEQATKSKNLAYKRMQQRNHTRKAVEEYRTARKEEKRVHKRKKKIFIEHELKELERLRSDNESKSFYQKKNSVALVRKRTIPTERPPPVGEVSANFCG